MQTIKLKVFKCEFVNVICKEGPDVNDFTKSFAPILNYEFYRLYYIVNIFLVKYQCLDTFHQTNYIEEFLDRLIL